MLEYFDQIVVLFTCIITPVLAFTLRLYMMSVESERVNKEQFKLIDENKKDIKELQKQQTNFDKTISLIDQRLTHIENMIKELVAAIKTDKI